MAVPILSMGVVLGVLNTESLELDAFCDSDRILMETLADNVEANIERVGKSASPLHSERANLWSL